MISMGMTTAQVLELCDSISYRQLDYWSRSALLHPGFEQRERSWPLTEVRVAVVMSRLVKVGMHAPDAARVARRAVRAMTDKNVSQMGVKVTEGVSIRIEMPTW